MAIIGKGGPTLDRMICIAGPTASGKTELAVALALALEGEVVSCDSMQVYRHMNIGTAKPTLEERRGVPHHMLDVAEPEEPMSVGKFVGLAAPVVADILARGKTAILAGGTGLYMDALVRGNDFAPDPDPELRRTLQAWASQEGTEPLLEELRRVDPTGAARLHPSDKKRIIRALEVYRQTGKTLTQHNLETRSIPPRYRPCWLGLDFPDRGELYRRIDLRVERMLRQGLLEEIQGLLAGGLSPGATALQAIGYKEFLDALEGRCTVQEAKEAVQKASRHYAKRQLTWFRRNKAIHWLLRQPGQDFPSFLSRQRRKFPFSTDPGDKIEVSQQKEGILMSEAMNLQDALLRQVLKERLPVTLFLMNGFQLRGVVTGFDNFVVILVTDNKQQMIYKHAISTLVPARPLKTGAPA